MKRLLFAIIVLLSLWTLGCSKTGSDPAAGKPGPSGPPKELPSPVTVAKVTAMSVPIEIRAFGTVEPNESVQMRSQATGQLMGVHFKRGQDVAAGDLLFTIDARPAKAQMAVAAANLARDKVQYDNALKDSTRHQQLFQKGLMSEAEYNRTRTAADTLAATLQADEAAYQNAKLSVEYSRIKSSISGRTGDILVQLGNLVKANETVLVEINQLQPIRVSFSLPQRELPKVLPRINGKDEAAREPLIVRALIPGDEEVPENGRVVLVNNEVDSATGTIKLWAEFENTSGRLWPGQLVNIVVTLEVQANALTVPTNAVQTGQKGTFVFVVGPNQTAESRPVTVMGTHQNHTIISQGLASGEQVITDGQLRLRPGSAISIRAEQKNGVTAP